MALSRFLLNVSTAVYILKQHPKLLVVSYFFLDKRKCEREGVEFQRFYGNCVRSRKT